MDQYILILLVGGFLVILSLLAAIFWFGGYLLPLIFGGAPYVPSAKKRVETMMRLAQFTASDHVIDMGSGDGLLLFSAIEAGAKTAEGYEIHPGLVSISRRRAKWKNLHDRITIHQRSYWNADLSSAHVVVLYQIPDSMERLERKLWEELPIGARVVSNAFPFPNWKPVTEENRVFLYRKTPDGFRG